ncbi:MAG: DUF58 domain-containing protein [Gemmatimonadota bacterium]
MRRLELTARRLLDSRALGAYDSVFRGHGIEFAEVRAYQPGDPFQAIDWKVSARMGRPYVKRFVEERELTVLLALDLSASTAFGTRSRQKRELATEVAGLLALSASRSNDRVGLLLFTDRVERFVQPTRGRNRVRCLLHQILDFQPEGRGTDVGVALESAARHLRVRSLVFILSDFQGPPFHRALAGAARRHDVVGIHLRDPAEAWLPPAGLVDAVDPETGARVLLDLSSPAVRDAVARRAAAEEDRLSRLFLGLGCDRILLHTDRPYAADLAAFFAARARVRRR